MTSTKSRKLALAVAGGILAGAAGCDDAPAPARKVPGASAAGAPVPAAASSAPAEKHACGGPNGCGANGCNAATHKKGSRTPKSP